MLIPSPRFSNVFDIHKRIVLYILCRSQTRARRFVYFFVITFLGQTRQKGEEQKKQRNAHANTEQNKCHNTHCHENAQPAPCPLFQLIRSVSEVTVPMPDLSEADKIKRGLHPLYSACSGTASTSILAWADPAERRRAK